MPVFAITLAASALLLFAIQPMVGKMILPTYGGSAGVWTTCMVFFQAVLVAGYAYAHGSMRLLGLRRQLVLHAVLLLLPFLVLPVALDSSAPPPPGADPVTWLLTRLFVWVGLPLFLVSSTAPLLQEWFARSGHRLAGDPYFLYAASNAGSLVALTGYPLLVEPRLTLPRQSVLWTAGYAVLVPLVLVCALRARRAARTPTVPQGVEQRADEPVSPTRRLRWILLALVPSSLLLGVTAHVTTNVAAVPLLWIVPLALYLLTFILAFARRLCPPDRWIVGSFLPAVLALGPLSLIDVRDLSWLGVVPHLGLFFLAALACHRQLAQSRPAPRHLTEFYLWIAIGGVLGGLFNAVAAPLLFNGIVEYPLMLAAAGFLYSTARPRRSDVVLPLVLAGLLVAVLWFTGLRLSGAGRSTAIALVALAAMACFTFRKQPLRFGLGLVVYLATIAFLVRVPTALVLHAERNFFGVKRVLVDDRGRFRRLVHGTTNHGMQWIDRERRAEPTAYYDRLGPMGDIFATLEPDQVGIVGLGVGGLAAYSAPGRRFTFYELDPAVERIARNTRWFTYLADCAGRCEVRIGDGRLQLAASAEPRFDLLVLDAFSSDAVPTHLLSLEAAELYLTRIAEHGVVVFNITNAYLDLAPVMGNVAARLGLVAMHRDDPTRDDSRGRMPAHYVAMARREQDLGALPARPGWVRLGPDRDHRVWTDRFSDVLGAFRAPRQPDLRLP